MFSEDDHFQILVQVRTPWTAMVCLYYTISGWKTYSMLLKHDCEYIRPDKREMRQDSSSPTKRLSVIKRDKRGRIFGSGNTSLAACLRTGSRRGPPFAHPQSVPRGSALPSVEPLRQSVAFFPLPVFFTGAGGWTYLKKYYYFILKLFEKRRALVKNSSLCDLYPNETSGTHPLKQQEWKEWIVQSSGTFGFGGFSTI